MDPSGRDNGQAFVAELKSSVEARSIMNQSTFGAGPSAIVPSFEVFIAFHSFSEASSFSISICLYRFFCFESSRSARPLSFVGFRLIFRSARKWFSIAFKIGFNLLILFSSSASSAFIWGVAVPDAGSWRGKGLEVLPSAATGHPRLLRPDSEFPQHPSELMSGKRFPVSKLGPRMVFQP